MSLRISLCKQGHCHDVTCLDLFIPVKANCNATAFGDILYECVLPTMWLQFGKEPHEFSISCYCLT